MINWNSFFLHRLITFPKLIRTFQYFLAKHTRIISLLDESKIVKSDCYRVSVKKEERFGEVNELPIRRFSILHKDLDNRLAGVRVARCSFSTFAIIDLRCYCCCRRRCCLPLLLLLVTDLTSCFPPVESLREECSHFLAAFLVFSTNDVSIDVAFKVSDQPFFVVIQPDARLAGPLFLPSTF